MTEAVDDAPCRARALGDVPGGRRKEGREGGRERGREG